MEVENTENAAADNSGDDGFSEMPSNEPPIMQFRQLGPTLRSNSVISSSVFTSVPQSTRNQHAFIPQSAANNLPPSSAAETAVWNQSQQPSVSSVGALTVSSHSSRLTTAPIYVNNGQQPVKFKLITSPNKAAGVSVSPGKSHQLPSSSSQAVQYRVLNSGGGVTSSARNQLQSNLSDFIKDSGLQAFAQEGGIYEKCGTIADPKVGYLVYKSKPDSEQGSASGIVTTSDKTSVGSHSVKLNQMYVGGVLKRFSNELLEEDPRYLKQMRFGSSGSWSPVPSIDSPLSTATWVSSTSLSSASAAAAATGPSSSSATNAALSAAEVKNKGLRHFALKVCQKVQLKGVTSYNEVADELVAEMFGSGNGPSKQQLETPLTNEQIYDQKNVRRRIYDALNVLMALNIISKDKKEIKWIGLPTNSAQELKNLELEREKRLERIMEKKTQLQELIMQHVAFKSLVQQNKEAEAANGGEPPDPSSVIRLPFVVINTSKDADVDCSIASDKREYLFNLDKPFEVHDDVYILKKMGFCASYSASAESSGINLQSAHASEHLSSIMALLPSSLHEYVHDCFKSDMRS